MPSTYTLISSNVLTSSAASVTFSAIPSTYTDLVVKISARTSPAYTESLLYLTINSDSSANYSFTRVGGNGTLATSYRVSSSTPTFFGWVNAGGTTSNTFSNIEFYIPSYTVSQNKPFNHIEGFENNATLAYANTNAGLWRNTAAITSLGFTLDGGSFVSGSSFYLYGIKNS